MFNKPTSENSFAIGHCKHNDTTWCTKAKLKQHSHDMIRDRAHTSMAKSRTIRDTGFPVPRKKFRIVLFKPPVRSCQERS
jgi:hypothetical protein